MELLELHRCSVSLVFRAINLLPPGPALPVQPPGRAMSLLAAPSSVQASLTWEACGTPAAAPLLPAFPAPGLS